MHIPGDLLCDIFRLVDGASVDQKFRLSQVCTYWREVALDAPLLWSSLTLADSLDANRLPILLARSRNLPLDIILPQNNSIRFNKPAVDLLTGRVRMRRLHIHHGTECCFLPRLLEKGFTFPLLEELVIIRTSEVGPQIFLFVSAPQLRRLHLTYTDCEKWHGLLVPSLEHFTLDYDPADWVPALLPEVFAHCRRLQTLSYRGATSSMWIGMRGVFPLQANPGPLVPLTGLQTLRLDMAVSPQFLRAVVGLRVLDEVEIVTSGSLPDQVTQELISEVFRGLDAVVELQFDKIEYRQSFSIRDRAGRIRRVSAAFGLLDQAWSLPQLWLELVQRLDIITTLQTLRANIIIWKDLVDAFAERPPDGELEMHLKLHRGYSPEFSHPYGRRLEALPVLQLNCPKLYKVVFHDYDPERIHWRESGLSRTSVILHLLTSITSTAPRISVCVSDAGLAKEAEDVTASALGAQFPVKYVLCSHC
ncbi:hypothetical protein EXIGLDRAFT_721050 [Exidia glandulosa HHB12029]|uniref:F-box domain-containing protein n=1 Tax=Exidia glandulosa HHB12029 TaxID=1314781 RepID=A0A165G0R0_EXIGL|nr:hypothetical protein EXIGLDRAFT_721050 [Exidia glandulosa HHB12029]